MPKLSTPLKITIYGEDDEIKDEYETNRVRWGILKAAIRMSKEIDTENPDEETIDALAGLVVEAFGNKFTTADLENADIDEMGAVLTQIVAKAGRMMGDKANPTKPV